jgi:hypothetical protein
VDDLTDSDLTVDSHHISVDPDPASHFSADPDPECHFYADPDPAFPFSADLDPTLLFNAARGTFHFNADPDPTFHFNADPDLAPHQSDANLRPLVYRSGSATLSSIIIKSFICFCSG